MALQARTPVILQFGTFEVDVRSGELRKHGVRIKLQEQPFHVLTVLLEHPGDVVTREELRSQIWPADTFVDFDNSLNTTINKLREALGDSADNPVFIETLPRRGYRFLVPVTKNDGRGLTSIDDQATVAPTGRRADGPGAAVTKTTVFSKLRRKPWIWVLAALAIVVSATALLLRMQRPPAMNEADIVLVSDFVNTTGEPVFDGSLKQALTVKLAESPYFNVALDSTTRKTLSMMGRSADERVVPPVAREVCQREDAKVVVGGSIFSFGNKYVLDLDAINCLTGASLAHQEVEALNREQVLAKLGQVIPPLRRKLGESVSSIQKFDTPIEQATTKSLAALKAFTSGVQKRAQGQEAESVPFFKMAIDLDPDFATAYTGLGSVNANLQQPDVAREYVQKAFERREHATEREKLAIQANYYSTITRESSKVIDIYKLWTELYPHDFIPFANLSNEYTVAGQLEKAIEAGQQALQLNPRHATSYACLGTAYQRATRFAEAKAICKRAVSEKLDNWTTHHVLYDIAFVEEDGPAMQREIDWFRGKPAESTGIYYQAKAALSQGKLRTARELFERARAIALEHGFKEQAVAINNGQAQFEADLSNGPEARKLANWSVRESPNSARHKAYATLALARAGDVLRSETLLAELNKEPSLGTALTEVVLPNIRAAVDLNRKNPASALEELRHATPYDLGTDSSGVTLYYRGLAYLELKSGKEASAQFQKILDNHGLVIVDIYWPLSHLGLARAYAQTGDREKSLGKYREFLTLWKNADPDLRILREAKAEYAKLQ
jgi:DNA-binding winged helix-turn-helix (wHTH) protein/tetratricopeptide (TPR) repeat protein